MKIIAITTPDITTDDASIIKHLLDIGIDYIHLRKPNSDIAGCRNLLTTLTQKQRSKIIIHDFHELYFEFSLKGIHINQNITTLPINFDGFKTRACHSFDEIVKYKHDYDYLFLSPIFNSISKPDYKSRFTHEELLKASTEGIIDDKVIALGGVTFDKIDYLKRLNFGGMAMIGGIYNINAICTK